MRVPPYSEEAERGVLGSMLISPRTVIAECVGSTPPAHFYVQANKTIYSALCDLWRANRAIDLITFTQYLRDENILESVGGAGYVTELYTFVPSSINVGYYQDIIRDKFTLREIISAATESIRCSYEEQANVELVIAQLQEHLIAAALPMGIKELLLADLIQDKLERMEQGEPDGDIIPTGITQLDRQSPLRRGDMPLITGQRKSGKSIFALTLAINIAKKNIPVLYFSLEDRIPKIIDRIMGSVSRIPTSRHHVSKLSVEELGVSVKAAADIARLPLFIRDDLFDLTAIVAVARQLKQKHKIGLFIVDYAQLIRSTDSKDGNREQKVAEVSRALRLLAMALDTPLILLCQLNQEGYTRESRALEQDATAMWKIVEEEDEPHLRYVQIPWQRNGPSGVGFKVTFLGEIARVENYAEEHANN